MRLGNPPKIRKGFRCAITGEVMFDPVMVVTGQTYEREAIEDWLKQHSTDPNTGVELASKTIIDNFAIKQDINDFFEEQPELWDGWIEGDNEIEERYISRTHRENCVKAIKEGNVTELDRLLLQDPRAAWEEDVAGTGKNLLMLVSEQHHLSLLRITLKHIKKYREKELKKLTAISAGLDQYLEQIAKFMGQEGIKLIGQEMEWKEDRIRRYINKNFKIITPTLLKALLQSEAVLNWRENGQSWLHYCVSNRKNERPDLLPVFVTCGLDVNITNDEGETALHLAVRLSALRCIEQLMELKADCFHPDNNGDFPLGIANDFSMLEVIRLLTADLEPKELLWTLSDFYRETPHKLINIAKLLGWENRFYQEEARRCIEENALITFEGLLALKLDVNALDKSKTPLLHMALKRQRYNLVNLMIKQADFDWTMADEKGNTALHLLSTNPNTDLLEQWIQHTPELLLKFNQDKQLPIQLAFDANQQEVVKKFANVFSSETLFFELVQYHEATVIKPLGDVLGWDRNFYANCAEKSVRTGNVKGLVCCLISGVGVNDSEPVFDQPLLYLATMLGQDAIVVKLLEWGASVNSVDEEGRTPLHHAAQGGHKRIIAQLLLYGAKPKAIDRFGKKPEEIALDEDTAMYLIDGRRTLKYAYYLQPLQERLVRAEALLKKREKSSRLLMHFNRSNLPWFYGKEKKDALKELNDDSIVAITSQYQMLCFDKFPGRLILTNLLSANEPPVVIKDNNLAMRHILLNALNGTNAENNINTILTIIEDKEQPLSVRSRAVRMLELVKELPKNLLLKMVEILKGPYHKVQKEVKYFLEKQGSLPEPVQSALVDLLKDENRSFIVVQSILEKQKPLSEEAQFLLLEVLKSTDWEIQVNVSEVFKALPELSQNVLSKLKGMLQHRADTLHYLVARILAERGIGTATVQEALVQWLQSIQVSYEVAFKSFPKQNKLLDTTKLKLKVLLDNTNSKTRFSASMVLGMKGIFNEKIGLILVEALKDEEARTTAARILKKQNPLSEPVQLALVGLLKEVGRHSDSAANILRQQSVLSKPVQLVLVGLLKNQEIGKVRRDEYANIFLEKQTTLSEPVQLALVELLKDQKSDHLNFSVLSILEKQPRLSAVVIEKLVAIFYQKNNGSRITAALVLGNQNHITESVQLVLVEALKFGGTQSTVASILQKQNPLSESVQLALVELLKERRAAPTAEAILRQQNSLSTKVQLALLHMLESNFARIFALKVLAMQKNLNQQVVMARLQQMYDNGSEKQRFSSAVILAGVKQTILTESEQLMLVSALKIDDTRCYATELLKKESLLPESVQLKLVKMLSTGDEVLCCAVIEIFDGQALLNKKVIKKIQQLCEDDNNENRYLAALVLANLGIMNELIQLSLAEGLKYAGYKIMQRLSDILKEKGVLPESAQLIIVEALKDNYDDCRSDASRILSIQGQLSETVQLALVEAALVVEAIEYGDGVISDVLAEQNVLSESVQLALVEAMKNAEAVGYVRTILAQRDLSEPVQLALVEGGLINNEIECYAILTVLARQETLSRKVIMRIQQLRLVDALKDWSTYWDIDEDLNDSPLFEAVEKGLVETYIELLKEGKGQLFYSILMENGSEKIWEILLPYKEENKKIDWQYFLRLGIFDQLFSDVSNVTSSVSSECVNTENEKAQLMTAIEAYQMEHLELAQEYLEAVGQEPLEKTIPSWQDYGNQSFFVNIGVPTARHHSTFYQAMEFGR